MKKIIFVVILLALVSCNLPSPTPTSIVPPTETLQPTPYPTYTPYPTFTPFPTDTPTATATATPEPTSTPLPTPTPFVLPLVYIVLRGDTLYEIALAYGVTVAEIVKANGLADPNLIFPGQALVIPAPSVPPSAPRNEGDYIIVVLSSQRLYFVSNGVLVNTFFVSTGLAQFPTPVGVYSIVDIQEYRLWSVEGGEVPMAYEFAFYHDYSLQSVWDRTQFGFPSSSGDIEMSTENAKWLYARVLVGTTVIVQP